MHVKQRLEREQISGFSKWAAMALSNDLHICLEVKEGWVPIPQNNLRYINLYIPSKIKCELVEIPVKRMFF